MVTRDYVMGLWVYQQMEIMYHLKETTPSTELKLFTLSGDKYDHAINFLIRKCKRNRNHQIGQSEIYFVYF